MTDERYSYLFRTAEAKLTQAEIAEGWHWCYAFDGLLVGPGMDELNCCSCWPKDHSVYLTAPPTETCTVDPL